LDQPTIEWRAVQICPDHRMRLCRRMHQVAGELWSPGRLKRFWNRVERIRSPWWKQHILACSAISRKIERCRAARLWNRLAKINRARINARRRSCLESAHRQAKLLQRIGDD